ncbi:MAG: TIM barrel protein, partial [Alphaproteobacteria bacterium]|nr:TIM barrel protein [Alphaproteobacteria bacterium]
MRDLSADAALLSLNTITVREQWSLAECIEGCVRHGIGGISPWRDKLEEMGAGEAARRIGDAGLTVTGLCRGGMFPAADAAGRQAALDDNRRAVDDACTIGARCLVLVVGGLPPGSRDIAGARDQVRDGIAKLLEHSRAADMPLAIEPLHPMYAADRACVNTLAQANDICDELGDDGLGIAVDLYHVWWDPDL